MEKKHEDLVGWEFPAADGGDYGIRLIDFNGAEGVYVNRQIRWSTGEFLDEFVRTITPFKLSYRYDTDNGRRWAE